MDLANLPPIDGRPSPEDLKRACQRYAYLNQIKVADMTEEQKRVAWAITWVTDPEFSDDKTRVLVPNGQLDRWDEHWRGVYIKSGNLLEGHQVIRYSDVPKDYE